MCADGLLHEVQGHNALSPSVTRLPVNAPQELSRNQVAIHNAGHIVRDVSVSLPSAASLMLAITASPFLAMLHHASPGAEEHQGCC